MFSGSVDSTLVSVIVCCYNVEKYVEEAVQSVMSQTYPNIEIVCVDDASTDLTLSILEELACEDTRIKIVRHLTNQSLTAVRASGLQAANGERVLFLDGDDY